MRILLFLRSSIDQTWVCGCILRFEFLHRLKVGRVGDDFGELFNLLELIQLRLLFFSNSSAHDSSSGRGFTARTFTVRLSLCPHNLNFRWERLSSRQFTQKAEQTIEN